IKGIFLSLFVLKISQFCVKFNLGQCLVIASPINLLSSQQSMPIILAVASMDSASFLCDKGFGADSPISGLISLLAAVHALSHVGGILALQNYKLQDRPDTESSNALVSSATNETLDALKHAQDSVKSESFTISSANASNPGYVPAYSTRLKYESGTWIVLPSNNSDPMGLVDAV
ncbi:Zn-dependent exopeptidases superfamily protein, partial [Prunus dulcis]